MATAAINPNSNGYTPRKGRISKDQLPPYIRRWLDAMDRSNVPNLTSYVPGYFDTGKDG